MPVLSLRQLATATAIRNVKYLNDIGNIPYALARPFLLKVESPEKLRSLELASPHIMKEDGELWLEFIKRDIPKWEQYDLPENPDSWYDVYCGLLERVRKSVEEDAEQMKMALEKINSERTKHSAKFVTDRRSIRLPRERPTTKQRYASYDRKMGGITPVFVSTSRSKTATADPLGAPAWTFERPQLPRSETTPTKRNNIFAVAKRNPALAVPTSKLRNKATQVKKAPLSLIEDHRRPLEPALASTRKDPPRVIAPGRSRSQSSNFCSSSVPMTTSLQEREARLRVLTSGHHAGSKESTISPAKSSAAAVSKEPSAASPPTSSPPLKSARLRSVTRNSTIPFPMEKKPQNLSRVSNHVLSKSQSNQTGESSNTTESKSPSEQSPRPMVMRKRPPPSVFIQPKRKKVS
ncbi:hypothetical protein MPDQ_003229 [Monascus purpureus]|uniref:RNA polymerase II transcription factor SIII subunit A n=1 Tax=Monascus purpureus TaxID=5098 RepID=A0A507QNI9_MONPU|nr:hypothetical protein MPDQ_003229 [Monascus purpureus]BDD63145.1 hypothetical protein MAP00_008081 [Monascus purpureus]